MDARTGRLVALAIVSGGLALTVVHNSLEVGQRVAFGNDPPIFAALTASFFSFAATYGSMLLFDRKRVSVALELAALIVLTAMAVSYAFVWRNIPSL